MSKPRSWVVLVCMTLDRLIHKCCRFPIADVSWALWQYTRVNSREKNVTRGHRSEEIPQNRCRENPCSQPPRPPTHGVSNNRAGPSVVHFPSFQKSSWTLFLHSRKSVCSLGHVERLQSRRERHTCLITSASKNGPDTGPEDSYLIFNFRLGFHF